MLPPGSEGSDATTLDVPVNDAALRGRRDIGTSSTLGCSAAAVESDDEHASSQLLFSYKVNP